MILTHPQIAEACQAQRITITPFEKQQIQPASYDLRVGEDGITTSYKKLTNIKESLSVRRLHDLDSSIGPLLLFLLLLVPLDWFSLSSA